jgi:broad specificity phosphatase PhoE
MTVVGHLHGKSQRPIEANFLTVEINAMIENLYLIRHATPDWNRKDIPYYLPPGPPLSREGLEEAVMLAEFFQFSGLHHIYTSPLERCLETARTIADKNEVALQIESGLSEHRPEESHTDVLKRLDPVLNRAIDEAGHGPVALVTHGSPIAILLSQLGMPPVALDDLRMRFDHHNPAPPAGVWEAVRSGVVWNLSLFFVPDNTRVEKLYGRI